METIKKDVDINDFTKKIYKRQVNERLDNLVDFELFKNTFPDSEPTYSFFISVSIYGHLVFAHRTFYSPQEAIDLALSDLDDCIESFKKLINKDTFNSSFFISQALIRKMFVSSLDSSIEGPTSYFSKKIRERAQKSDNNFKNFCNIMQSIY